MKSRPLENKELSLRPRWRDAIVVAAVLAAAALTGAWTLGKASEGELVCVVSVDGAEVALTATEHKILRELVLSRGRVLPRERLLDTVWDTDFEGTSRTVDTHMRRLRGKLGPYADWIETVRGVGYRFKAPAKG